MRFISPRDIHPLGNFKSTKTTFHNAGNHPHGVSAYGVSDGGATGLEVTDTTLPFLVGAGAGSGSGRSKHSGNVMLKKPDKTGCAMGHKKLKARLKKPNSSEKSCASAEPIDARTTKTTTRKRRGMNIMVSFGFGVWSE